MINTRVSALEPAIEAAVDALETSTTAVRSLLADFVRLRSMNTRFLQQAEEMGLESLTVPSLFDDDAVEPPSFKN